MEFKGTKDWYLGEDSNIFSREVEERLKNPEYKDVKTNGDNGEIAQCWIDFHDGKIISEEECKANAKLIVSAPKLLEALQFIIEMNRQTAKDQYGDADKAESWSCVKVAREAIKQAISYDL